MVTHIVKVFNRFERFWHWSQMLLIFILLYTGFSIHGLYQFNDFKTMVMLHAGSAISLIVLWIFAIFWHMTTGTWRHYLPTTDGLFAVARYYAFDIFKGKQHPYRKHFWRKHNPLQALTYLALKLFLFPAIWISGLIYLLYDFWAINPMANQTLALVALVHVATAFAMLVFIIIHVYMLTTDHSFMAHVKPMITGFDEVELTEAEEQYLKQDEPGKIRE
jgi:thiosulfate reductase cytochrome b subunit